MCASPFSHHCPQGLKAKTVEVLAVNDLLRPSRTMLKEIGWGRGDWETT
jgi:hypothetical protein